MVFCFWYTVIMKNHSEKERREFIKSLPRKRSASGVVLRNNKGEWLLLQTTYHGGKYTFPGGITNQYESPWRGVIREVKEEINIDIHKNDLSLLTITSISDPKNNDELVIYYFDGGVLDTHQINSIQVDGEEIQDYKFVSQDRVLGFLRDTAHYSYGHISEALKKNKILMIDVEK